MVFVGDDWERWVYEMLFVVLNVSLVVIVEGMELWWYDFVKVVLLIVWFNDEIVNGVFLWFDRVINLVVGIKDLKK